MDFNDYMTDVLVRQRLEHARAFAARHALVSRRRAPRPSLRERLGVALIALGERIVGAPPARRSYAARGASHG